MSTVDIAIAIAVICIGWSLWYRRFTWTCRWECVLTLAAVFQGVGMILAAPPSGGDPDTVDDLLHSLTGLWELADLIGDLLFIGAAAAFAYTALSRAVPPDRLAELSPRLIRFPGGASGAILVITYAVSGLHARPNALDHVWWPAMRIYWAALSVGNIYLQLGAAVALWLLRRTPRHRVIANLYLFACLNGIAACLARVAAVFGPQAFRTADVAAVWVFGALWGGGFALAAAYSWHQKMGPFRSLMDAVRT